MSPSDRVELYRALKRCSPAQFGEVLLLLGVDASHLPPASAEIAARAQALIHLVEQHPSGLDSLRGALREAAPALFRPPPRAQVPLGRFPTQLATSPSRSGPHPAVLVGAIAVASAAVLVGVFVVPRFLGVSGRAEPDAGSKAVAKLVPAAEPAGAVEAPPTPAKSESAAAQSQRPDVTEQILVWTMMDGDLPVAANSKPRYRTALLSSGGEQLASVEGLYAMSDTKLWKWVLEERPLYANDCGEMFGETPSERVLTQQVAWFEEVNSKQRIEVVAPQPGNMTAGSWSQSTVVLGSVGARFFIATQSSGYFCGASGSLEAEFIVVDLESGRVIPDPVSDQEKKTVGASFFSSVESGFDRVDDMNGWRDSPLTITAYMTRWTPNGFRMLANVSAGSCAACGDGDWKEGWLSERVSLYKPLGPYRTGFSPPFEVSVDPSGAVSVTAGWTRVDSQRVIESVFH